MTEKKSAMFIPLYRPMTLDEIAAAAEGKLFARVDRLVSSITTDSREVEEGSVFVAIKGERLDGHQYIGKAFENGAACVLCSELPDGAESENLILTGDTVRALGAIAAAHKAELEPLTAAVTGSVGKTTTKQFVYSVLSAKFNTHKTDGNFNNEIGLPLVLLKLTPEHEALVLEMGMSYRGELSRMTRLARPDIAVITNIGTSHIENLGSREGIRDAKLEIREGLKPNGTLILNGDEELLAGIDKAVYVSMAGSRKADFRVLGYREITLANGEAGTSFDLGTPDGTDEDLRIPVIGAHNVLDAAFAYAVGYVAGLTRDEIRRGLGSFQNTGMRQKFIDFNGVTLIEDCYNASPESMSAALAVLRSVSEKRSGKSVAVLGEMRELGSYGAALHRKVGGYAVENGVDALLTFGEAASEIAAGALEHGMDPRAIFSFGDLSRPELVSGALSELLSTGDTALFKASRAVELERVIKLLTRPVADPKQSEIADKN